MNTKANTNKPANRKRGETPLEFEGRTIRLVPSFANIAAAEAVTEKSMLDMATSLQAGTFFVSDMARILACVSEPKLDMDDVERMVEGEGFLPVIEAVGGFIASALTAGRELPSSGKKPKARAKRK